jgi:hypothetical protein
MVSRVQNFFIGLLVANEVPDSTSRLLWSYGITTADKLYTRIPSTEALESFLTNKVRLLQGTDEKSVETQRAKGYSKKFLSWLELMVLGSMGFTKPDQLVCGRIRLSAQASIRNDDLRRTPSGRVEWVYDPQGDERREFRGILTRAQHTKTLPRHWACSRLGVTEQGDGWLEATVGLLAMAHGDGFATAKLTETSTKSCSGGLR